MPTNVAKKAVKQRPAGKDDKIVLNGVTPREVETDNGRYELQTIPGKEFSFKSLGREDYIEINAYQNKERKEVER